MLSPPGAEIAGMKGVLKVVILAEEFLRLTAWSMNVQRPMDAKHKVHVYASSNLNCILQNQNVQ